MKKVEVDPEDASRVLGNLHWSERGIVVLPDIIGDLTVSGNLYLHDNKLESLPESFGSITTTGKWSKVWLNNNPVAESLHENSYPGLSLELLDDY